MDKIKQIEGKLNVMKNEIQRSLASSDVVRTFNELFFNNLSLDHKGQFNFNANAKYSMSLGSGQISEAFFTNSLNSENEIRLIFEDINENKILISSIESPDFSDISFLYLPISYNKYSGEYNFNLSENSISAVLPDLEIKEAIIIFASITNSINNYLFSSLNLLCKEAFIFLPIFKASFSVNFDFETIDLNNINCEILILIASRATADQLTSLNSSICFFASICF